MHAFENLRLPVRLALAGVVVVLVLAAILAAGLTGLRSVDRAATSLAEHDLLAVSLVGRLRGNAQGGNGLTAEHLYVYDGDLAAQDRVAKRSQALNADSEKAAAALRPLLDDSETRTALAEVERVGRSYGAQVAEALSRSRQETVDEVEERDGSRTLYTETILPALEGVEKTQEQLDAAVRGQADRDAAAASATADRSSTLLVAVGLAGLALVAAILFLVARSVTVPVKRLLRTVTSLYEHCIKDLHHGITRAATGDLTCDAKAVTPLIRSTTRDEIGDLSRMTDAMLGKMTETIDGYNAMRGDLGSPLGEVSSTADTIAGTATQIDAGATETSRAVDEVVSAITGVAEGAERQTTMVSDARSTAAGAVDVAERARTIAGDGVPDSRPDRADRRADEPARAERGHRGRARRRAGSRLRRRGRGGPQARRDGGVHGR